MNALQELKEAIQYYKLGEIYEASIRFDCIIGEYRLGERHTQEDLDSFMSFLDREYDEGYGLQELFGFVAFRDGSILKRGEYDGSEWWEIHVPYAFEL